MNERKQTEKWVESWAEEKQSAFLYEVMAAVESGTPRERMFRALAEAAEQQSLVWAAKVTQSGSQLPKNGFYAPTPRVRMVAALIRSLGPRRIKHMLAAMKVRGLSVYSSAAPIEPTRGHALRKPHETPRPGGGPEETHRSYGGAGTLRAAVFGVNDGLVSNASLIMGVAGAAGAMGAGESKAVVISGVAGLLAGALSMASGEYISVRSQRELYEYQIGLEAEELEAYPEEEAKELALIYEAKGIPASEAQSMADRLIADPARALDTLSREELGLNPDDLGSPVSAAISSFFSFAVGASIPLLPFLLHLGTSALTWSMGLVALTLFAVGALISLFTGRQALWGGTRMLLLGAMAGGATFAIGRWLGVSLS